MVLVAAHFAVPAERSDEGSPANTHHPQTPSPHPQALRLL